MASQGLAFLLDSAPHCAFEMRSSRGSTVESDALGWPPSMTSHVVQKTSQWSLDRVLHRCRSERCQSHKSMDWSSRPTNHDYGIPEDTAQLMTKGVEFQSCFCRCLIPSRCYSLILSWKHPNNPCRLEPGTPKCARHA